MEHLQVILTVSLLIATVNTNKHQTNNALYRCGIRKRFGEQLIHHGQTAELGQWPWHAAIYHRIDRRNSPNGTYKCGATLIDQQHVLTAAHCVVSVSGQSLNPQQLAVHLGKHELYKFDGQLQIVNVSEVHIHEEYSPNRHDVALLVLDEEVRYSEYVVPICLEPVPGGRADDLVGQLGWVAGWGINENGTLSEVLKTTQMPVVDITECARSDPNLFGRFVSQAVYCASDRNGTSVCVGDSGGGMYFSTGDRWELRGIVSFGSKSKTGSCDTSKYIMFVNVAHYHSWIRKLTDGRIGHVSNVIKRISEKKCEEYATIARKRSNGVCNNVRSPHTVSVIKEGFNISCSATVISELYVLSSAACGQFNSSQWKIRAGSEEDMNIAQAIVHPLYNHQRRSNNLMLLKLVEPLVLGSRFLPACLANAATENLYDSLMVTGYTGRYRRFYKNVNIKALSTAECVARQKSKGDKRTVSPVEVCVVAHHEEEFDGEDYLLAGITGASLQTFNSRSCMFTTLGVSTADGLELEVYTRVASHLEWIESIVWADEYLEDEQTSTDRAVVDVEMETESVDPATTTVSSRSANLYNKYSHDFYFPDG
ncbi:polyserase-2-like [Aedes albopictus]|uniref:Peptidase S1 domain-containing protein n=1 Tax=Aedes albopictus TaxID=7160 RepID=A0ABM1XL32_AEDAL|nr:polyserase-2-like isoform X1 [Aedes albopictus]